jgi:hypothetical protein
MRLLFQNMKSFLGLTVLSVLNLIIHASFQSGNGELVWEKPFFKFVTTEEIQRLCLPDVNVPFSLKRLSLAVLKTDNKTDMHLMEPKTLMFLADQTLKAVIKF